MEGGLRPPGDSLRIKCEACYRQFEREEELTVHMRKVHPGPDLLTCQVGCGYTTRKRKLLMLHMKRSHVDQGRAPLHTCETCQRTYRSSDGYRAHLKTHERPPEDYAASLLLCIAPGCGFGAKFQSDLDRHAVKHSAGRDVGCSECDFVCKRKSELNRHRKLKHSDMPERTCQECDYKTRSMDHMKRHVRLKHKGPSHSAVPSVEVVSSGCAGLQMSEYMFSVEGTLVQAPDYAVETVVV